MTSVKNLLINSPIKLLYYMSKIVKNSLYTMALILLMGKFYSKKDFLHLQNQIFKKKYKTIYGKGYIPIHLRLMNTIQSSSQIIVKK
jgi:hypothetical protein